MGSLGYLSDASPEGVSCCQVPGIWGGVAADPKERRCREEYSRQREQKVQRSRGRLELDVLG